MLLCVAGHLSSFVVGIALTVVLVGDGFFEFYANGGLPMHLVAMAGAAQATLGIGLSLVHLRVRPLPFALHFLLPAATVAVGLWGVSLGVNEVGLALADAPSEYRGSGLALGMSIAAIPGVFGAVMGASGLIATLTLAALSIRHWQRSGDETLASSALSAGLVGGAAALLVGVGLVWARAQLALMASFRAYTEGADFGAPLAEFEAARGQLWIALVVGALIWAGLVVWARRALSRGKKLEPVISLACVALLALGLGAYQRRAWDALELHVGVAWPEALAAGLGPKARAVAVRPRPVPTRVLLHSWTAGPESQASPLALALALDPEGGACLAGASWALDAGEAFVECVDVYGALRWSERWELDERASVATLARTGDGRLVAHIGEFSGRQFLRVYQSDGELDGSWELEAEGIPSLALSSDDRILIASRNPAYVPPLPSELEAEEPDAEEPDSEEGPSPALLRSWDTRGKLLETRELDASGHRFVAAPSGELYFAGSAMVESSEERAIPGLPKDAAPFRVEPRLIKLDADGREQWRATWGNGSCAVTDLAVDGEGRAYVLGKVRGPIADDVAKDQPSDVYIARVSATGEVEGLDQFGTEARDEASRLWLDGDAVWIAGTTEGSFPGHTPAPEGQTSIFVLRREGEAMGESFQWASSEGAHLYDAVIGEGQVYALGQGYGPIDDFFPGDDGGLVLLRWGF